MAQYTIGQVLPNGETVVSDTITNYPDGSILEQMTDSAGNTENVTTPSPAQVAQESAMANAITNLQTLLLTMAPAITQGQADLVTLSSSTDPNAPIISRNIQASLAIAQAIQDVLTVLQLIPTG